MKVYALFDEKSQSYGTPFFQLADGQASRSLQELVNDPQSLVAKYPEDFALYKLGEFDERTGMLNALNVVEFICRASAFSDIGSPVASD